MIYLDNILIYSNNMPEHCQHVKKILKCLCKTGLYTKAEKYEFHFESVKYLEYILFTILSIINEENEVYPVTFHSCTFTVTELNYDTHDKKLLVIFKAFKIL